MRIYGVSSSINFGYNKELNDTVNKKLEKPRGNKDLAKALLDMNKFCMNTEDKLRDAEKANNKRLRDAYASLLIDMKPLVTYEINERFPNLKYRETELATYNEEIKDKKIKDDMHWLPVLADNLKTDDEFLEECGYSSKEIEDVDKKRQAKQKENNDDDEDEVSGATLVEKFEPTEFSPRGFSSLGGMQELKESLKDKIISPLEDPELAKLDEVEYGKKAPRGILLYGPPGCGKTSVIEALAGETKLPLYKLKISKCGSKYINESSTNIQKAYEYVCDSAKASGAPVFFVLDEMEALTPKRKGDGESSEDGKMVGTLLQIIEEARGKNVVIIGATNLYDSIDDAIKSRFDDKKYIGLPDDDTRRQVLQIHLNKRTKGQALASNPEELDKVVKLTKGFSNRDIAILTDKAALLARRDSRREICAEDFNTPVNENQNMKVKEFLYQDKQTKPTVGFSR
jgi:SpoVK/Ycf46/Vps4 family AAA+-type ATPase